MPAFVFTISGFEFEVVLADEFAVVAGAARAAEASKSPETTLRISSILSE